MKYSHECSNKKKKKEKRNTLVNGIRIRYKACNFTILTGNKKSQTGKCNKHGGYGQRMKKKMVASKVAT